MPIPSLKVHNAPPPARLPSARFLFSEMRMFLCKRSGCVNALNLVPGFPIPRVPEMVTVARIQARNTRNLDGCLPHATLLSSS